MSGLVPIESQGAPLASVEDLVGFFRAGNKPPSAWRVGVEQEKITILGDDGRPAPFDGPSGVEALLLRLEGHGYTGIRENGRLLALQGRGGSITVEPGGQVELSGPTLETAVGCREELVRHVREVGAVAQALGMRFLAVGLAPFGTLEEHPWLPKGRYGVMRRYLPRHGRLGHQMMKRTATVQANLDYDDEATAADKMRAAFGVTSIVTALFAASSITEGRPNGYQSYRAAIWLDTDEQRCGLLPFVFERGFGFRNYVEWALDVPMFFVVRGGVYHEQDNLTFRRFMREGWNDQRATMDDWRIHLSTLFPEVRLKQYIEVRGADAGPLAMAIGLPALWRGLLDDKEACIAAFDLVRRADMNEREVLRRSVPKQGMTARFLGRSVQSLAVELCRIAAEGLSRLPGGAADRALLEPLLERATTGRAPAADMLDDHAATKGDPRQLVDRWQLTSS